MTNTESNWGAVPELGSVVVIIPTLNAAADWPSLTQAIRAQGIAPRQVWIIDSESTDGTAEAARQCGYQVKEIARSAFNHGGTRQWALQFFPHAEIVVFLTQDAILVDGDALKRLLAAFSDPTVAAAFGRQLPRLAAGPIEAHARLYNYPQTSGTRSLATREKLGIKTIFLSNSFAAYRRSALNQVGGFPSHVILGEDTVVAARLLLQGWQVAYVAEAAVYHSHPYSAIEDFKRYFDTGVLHSREAWMLEEFGRAGGEGLRFVRSELSHLSQTNPALIPSAMARTLMKFVGYRLGKLESRLGPALKRRLSMHHRFWASESTEEDRRAGATP